MNEEADPQRRQTSKPAVKLINLARKFVAGDVPPYKRHYKAGGIKAHGWGRNRNARRITTTPGQPP
jgi:hypothetical protein